MNMTTSAQETQAEQLHLLLTQTATSARFSAIAALFSFGVLAVYQYTPWLAAWLLGTLGVAMVRMQLIDDFRKCDPSRCDLATLERRHHYSGIVSGLVWGLLGIHPVDGLPLVLQSFTLLSPALIATAALSSHVLRVDHYRSYLLALMGSLLASYSWRHGMQALVAWPVFGLFGTLLYSIAHRYNQTLADALSARNEMEQAHRELAEANRHLLEQHKILAQEESIARHVFEQLTLANDERPPGIHAWNQPMGTLSGDLIQVVRGPDGSTYVFLGDFTGHGLPAALGAVPASTVFRTMAEKGLEVALIARELNCKLHTLLPTGYFCCAVIMKVNPERCGLKLWNGGLPPVLIRRHDGYFEEIPADNLPLGVVGDAEFTDHCTRHSLAAGDRVLVYSDGLIEAENHEGVMWGRKRLLALLTEVEGPGPAIERLRAEILEFTHLAPASDDISVIEIEAGDTACQEAVA